MPATSSGVGDFPVDASSKLAVAEDDLKHRRSESASPRAGTAPGRARAHDGQHGRAVDVLGLDQQIGTVLRELLRQLVAWWQRPGPDIACGDRFGESLVGVGGGPGKSPP
jgi:hypothetical protein